MEVLAWSFEATENNSQGFITVGMWFAPLYTGADIIKHLISKLRYITVI